MWAHVISGIVRECPVQIADGFTIQQCYPAAFVAECVAVPSGVTPAQGWIWDGTAFAAPVAPAVPQQPVIRAQLADLDQSIPRGLEDMWEASGFDVTKLPAATQAKLAQKVTLRTQLAALRAAGTP